MKKVFHVGVLIYFVMPVLITVEKPPVMNLNAEEKGVCISVYVCIRWDSFLFGGLFLFFKHLSTSLLFFMCVCIYIHIYNTSHTSQYLTVGQ